MADTPRLILELRPRVACAPVGGKVEPERGIKPGERDLAGRLDEQFGRRRSLDVRQGVAIGQGMNGLVRRSAQAANRVGPGI